MQPVVRVAALLQADGTHDISDEEPLLAAPPPPPPPPGLGPPVSLKRRKTLPIFNAFDGNAKQTGSTLPLRNTTFKHRADYDLWRFALSGQKRQVADMLPSSSSGFRLLTIPSPPPSMASWGLREYVMLQQIGNQELEQELMEVIKEIDAWEEHQVTKLVEDVSAQKVELFADVSMKELTQGIIYSQTISNSFESTQDLWRASLGSSDQSEFRRVLNVHIDAGLPTWLSAVDAQINHIARCATWPLRMYLRMQQQLAYKSETEDKLKLLLQSEKTQVVRLGKLLHATEAEWLHGILSLGDLSARAM